MELFLWGGALLLAGGTVAGMVAYGRPARERTARALGLSEADS